MMSKDIHITVRLTKGTYQIAPFDITGTNGCATEWALQVDGVDANLNYPIDIDQGGLITYDYSSLNQYRGGFEDQIKDFSA